MASSAGRAQLDDAAVEPGEADHGLGELASERAQRVGVRVDDARAAEDVAREAGQAVAAAVDEAIRAIGPDEAEPRAQRERPLDAPPEQRAVDLREALGGRRQDADLVVVRIEDREPELGAAVVRDPDVLAGREAGHWRPATRASE
jgi:hypothetical protein